METQKNLKIAWLTPPRKAQFSRPGNLLYWEPLFEEFQKEFPDTTFFTQGDIHPYYRKKFNVHSVGRSKWIPLFNYGYYKRGFIFLSPGIILKLLKTKPKTVITSGFNLWTILSALFKKFGRWKLIILWEGSSPTVDYKDNYFRTLIRKYAAKRSDALITNSYKGKDYLQKYLKINPKKVHKIIYEIPEIKKTKTDKLSKYKRPIFLYVGRLIPRKGINYLIDAWSGVQEQSKEGSLLIIGDGSQREKLEKQVKKLGLKDIYFTGKIDNKKLNSWYQSADVFVFPSLEETWGVVVLEAMSFGKPILCSKHAGASELVHNNKNGFVFDPRNTGEFVNLIFRFVKSPTLINLYGKQSKKVFKIYNHLETVSKFKEIINQ